MKNILLAILFLSSIAAFGVTANKVWRVPSGATLPAWGPVNLADNTNAVTGILPYANMPALVQAISSSTGSFSTTSSSYVDVTNASVSVTVTGRPVVIAFVSDGSGSESYIQATSSNSGNSAANCTMKLLEGSTEVATYSLKSAPYAAIPSAYSMWPPGSIYHFYIPSAGTYTIKAQVKANSAESSCQVAYSKLIAYEL